MSTLCAQISRGCSSSIVFRCWRRCTVFSLACTLAQVVKHMVRGAPSVTITGQSGIGQKPVLFDSVMTKPSLGVAQAPSGSTARLCRAVGPG